MEKIHSTRVCIIQSVLKQYRAPFFLGLEKELNKSNISLEVIYSKPNAIESLRRDNTDLASPLGKRVPNVIIFNKLYFQLTLFTWLKADLVIIEPANKYVLNYLFYILSFFGIKRFASWGHGYDRQTDPKQWSNKFKKFTLKSVNWWFAYTDGASKYIQENNFSADKITVVDNAVDTSELRLQLDNISPADVEKKSSDLGLKSGDRIGLYCGSLYENKNIRFLFTSCDEIHKKTPRFRLIILGGGPLATEAKEYADARDWVCYLGPVFGHDKAIILKMAELWLNPGLVGLGILDAFTAGLPVITTNVTYHSPEIEYLNNQENGLIVNENEVEFTSCVVNLFNNKATYDHLVEGALASSQKYTIDRMVSNFAKGIVSCLNQ
jgi:glycosyltransferase involved in cell wall biosynthesis